MMSKINRIREPVTVHWDITKSCNFSCEFCMTESGRKSAGELDTHEIFAAIDDFYDSGILFLKFLGGEPFSKPRFADILDYAAQKGMILSFSTNGSLITEAIADRLFKIKDNIAYLQVSVYAASEVTYDKLTRAPGQFAKVKNALKLLNERYLSPFVFTCITDSNLKELPEIHRIVSALGVQAYRIGTIVDCGRAEDKDFLEKQLWLEAELIDIIKILVHQWKHENCVFVEADGRPVIGNFLYQECEVHTFFQNCKSGITLAYVNESGKFSPCPFLNYLSNTKEMAREFNRLDIREMPFLEIWNSQEFERFRIMHNPEWNTGIRSSCKYFKNNQCVPCPLTPCGCVDRVKSFKRGLNPGEVLKAQTCYQRVDGQEAITLPPFEKRFSL